MSTRRARFLFVLLVLGCLIASALPGPSSAAQAAPKKFSFEQAFLRQPPVVLKPMTPASGWFDDEHYLLRERDEKAKSFKLWKVRAKTGQKILLLDYDLIQKKLPEGLAASAPADQTPDFGRLIYEYKGDLYLYSHPAGLFKRLTATIDEEKNARLSPDGRFLAYTRANNLFALDIEGGLEYQLTSDGSPTVYNGWASWVYYEEILGRGSRYAAFWWSPDSRRIAFLRFDDGPVPTFTLVRSAGVHGEVEVAHYPKPGDPNPKVRLGIAALPEAKVVWADFDPEADAYLAWPVWFSDGSKLSVQWMNRGQDAIKIYAVDPATGKKEEIHAESQPSWVEFFEDLTMFKDGSGFLLRSDVDGWRHLYAYDLGGKLRARVTSGDWAVTGIGLVDEKNGKVYFSARRDPTTESHLYVTRLDGSGLERLTREPGTHWTSVSPGGSYFLDTFSSITAPARQNLCTTGGVFVRAIDTSETPAMKDYAWGKVELFTIPTEDGWNLPARWILPPDFDPARKYPVLFSIYGGPESTDVANSFPSLGNVLYAQEGIIVLSVDHRGSSHFGKKGTALMHRNLGKWEMHDWGEAVRWLRQKPFVDPDRIGITGGSYGGYATCLALTCDADYFTHGYASSSVTDWKLYDSVYTERYMDTPAENPQGYEFGSVLTHAAKLKGRLFMVHGDMDDNVHMQNSVQLINAFMDLGKEFEFMLYPGQRHGFGGKKREHDARSEYGFWMKHFLNR
jgi:dipeptidyl-peptidase-4